MDCFLGHLMYSKSGLKIEKKCDQPSQFFFAGQIQFSLVILFFFLPAKNAQVWYVA